MASKYPTSFIFVARVRKPAKAKRPARRPSMGGVSFMEGGPVIPCFTKEAYQAILAAKGKGK